MKNSLRKIFLFAAFVCTAVLTSASSNETQIQYLSGKGFDDAVQWDFFCSEGRRSGEWTKIRVPSCWEQEGFGTYNYGVQFYGKPNPPGIAKEQGKYRHSFDVPADWQGKRVRLVFEASMTDTAIRVNGISTGLPHQGGFYRFKTEITSLLKFGAKNEIEVTVDKESANESVNLAERRADYWNFGGIFRPVFLEILPPQFIDRSAIDAKADGTFRAEIFLGDAAVEGTKVVGQIFDAAGTPVGLAFEAAPAPGGERATLATAVTQPKLWTAETPNLYTVKIAVVRDGATLHAATERFGFRTFEVRAGEGLFLNGQRVLLKGANRHSFWPETGRTLNRERNYADVRLIKEMNMNAVRMSHYPPDPDFLEACDELGLYVLNELGGWHGRYDEPTGRRLVGEMISRDVNHPSILFWDNGNEGGWNAAIDDEFAKWDPQQRPVLHPQGKFSGIDTMHYRSYGETQEYFRAPELFMPTEFLHGLYDGGHGAGLFDYWEMMRNHPRSGGGFLWSYADEGLARTDQNGRIDQQGNLAPDGIVGPHHEKEGSFNTIREVWSPVQVGPAELPADFNGVLSVENRYDFTHLNQCKFVWEMARFYTPAEGKTGHESIARGELAGPAIAPHSTGTLQLPLPKNWRDADVLYVTAKNPAGEPLWTWSWSWKKAAPLEAAAKSAAKAEYRSDYDAFVVFAGGNEFKFSKSAGELTSVRQAQKAISFKNGPRFVAARRGDRTLDGSVDPQAPKGEDRLYKEITTSSSLKTITARADGADVVVEAKYFGSLESVAWRISPSGVVRLDYEYRYDGVVELMGVKFDYPESSMKSIRWLGRGPYRVWQNRLHGTTLDVWANKYNDPIPGESYVYPEFKGYFRDWRWAVFSTTEGEITIGNGTPGSYLGVYTPRDGRDALLYTLPQTGIAVLDVIPAVRNKVNATDLVGPSSQAQRVGGVRRGSIELRFEIR
ncbi:MAG: glycoside hydrolase family 2 TIM barrel-domain containing protein [Nibricoccus sp.]